MSISSGCDDNLNRCLYIKFSGNITCKVILISLLWLSRSALRYCFMFSKVLNTESTLFKFCHCLKAVALFSPQNFFSGLPNFSMAQKTDVYSTIRRTQSTSCGIWNREITRIARLFMRFLGKWGLFFSSSTSPVLNKKLERSFAIGKILERTCLFAPS